MTLTEDERTQLVALLNKGRVAARRLTRAPSLWHAHEGATQEAMAAALPSGRATVVRLCQRVVAEGLEAARQARPRPGAQRQLDGQPAALLLALAGRTPPTGRTGWPLPWLADTLVERRVVDAMADEPGRRTLTTMS